WLSETNVPLHSVYDYGLSYGLDEDHRLTPEVSMYKFKELMKSAGWTVKMSSDSVNWNPQGVDYIDGPDDMGANGSYIVLKNGNREILIGHKDTDVMEWYLAYSYSGQYVGGGAVAYPTAVDSQDLHGTAAVGGCADFFEPHPKGYAHMMADDASASFLFFTICRADNEVRAFFCGDELLDPVAGDSEPYAINAYYNTGFDMFGQDFFNAHASVSMRSWYDIGGAPSFSPMSVMRYYAFDEMPDALVNPSFGV
ncbi:unnamed protein product, partial [marine sediment metagenome]